MTREVAIVALDGDRPPNGAALMGSAWHRCDVSHPPREPEP